MCVALTCGLAGDDAGARRQRQARGAGAGALPPVSVGAGVQTSYVHDMPDGRDLDGQVPASTACACMRERIRDPEDQVLCSIPKYDGGSNHVTVLDAVAQIGISDKVNFWMGRMLPPSDRANLYGPYYSHHWAVYTDGVQDGYPFVATGRDNGFLYFGQFDKLRLEGGVYDGESATGSPELLTAARGQYDFWDPEPGHYMNGTFYGDKNILARRRRPRPVAERRRRRLRRQNRPTRGISCSKRRWAAAARSRSSPSSRATTSWAATTRTTRSVTAATSSAASRSCRPPA